MASEWAGSLNDRAGALSAVAAVQARRLAEPGNVKRLRWLVLLVAAIWLAQALVQLIWSLVPAPEPAAAQTAIINPLSGGSGAVSRQAVEIDRLVKWNLFGTLDSVPVRVKEVPVAQAQPTDGIEKGAKETRLNLRLQGLVSSPDPSFARAIIEYQGKQQQYSIDDKLPVQGRVTLAKVLPDRVVINNSGKYELLLLFDEEESSAPLLAAEPPPAKSRRDIDNKKVKELTELAQSYRERLYSNPQSLAEVVRISAVRVDGSLQGYRVSAGKDKEQFAALGFEANDVVTAVNGIELNDPGKAMELYRVMRSAKEATFNIRRGEEDVTLSVGLDGQEAQ